MWLVKLIAVLVFTGAASAPARAAVAAPVMIAVDEYNPPYMYKEDGKAKGIYPEVIRAIFKVMKIDLAIESLPWNRAIERAALGQWGVGGAYKTADREAKFTYSDPIYTEPIKVFTTSKAGFRFRSLEDLRGMTIGVIEGWSYGPAFDEARRAHLFKVEENVSDLLNFAKLRRGRIDAVVAVELAGHKILKDRHWSGNVAMHETPVSVNPTYLMFPKSPAAEDLLKKFNVVLASMRADHSLEQLFEKNAH